MISTFEVDRDDRSTTRVVEESPALQEGDVIARIDHFALTSNNVTYSVIGHMLGYWDFFPPAPGDGGVAWGRVPAFGHAEIVESRCDEVAIGERLYGYFPMATHVVLQPGRSGPRGFTDMAAHRQPMSEVYNRYTRVRDDPLHDPSREHQRVLLHPLFSTAFVIDDFFADNGFFGADTAVVSSASSKTAIGTAHLMGRRDEVHVVGLTSAPNREFVTSLGCYDDVVLYDAIDELEQRPAVYVDIAGAGPVRRAVHERFGGELAYSSSVGATDWDDMDAGAEPLPGPAPELFFAPSQIAKRHAEWGRDVMEERMLAAWTEFSQWSDDWLEIVVHRGPDALTALWLEMLPGRVDPRLGHIVEPAAP